MADGPPFNCECPTDGPIVYCTVGETPPREVIAFSDCARCGHAPHRHDVRIGCRGCGCPDYVDPDMGDG